MPFSTESLLLESVVARVSVAIAERRYSGVSAKNRAPIWREKSKIWKKRRLAGKRENLPIFFREKGELGETIKVKVS